MTTLKNELETATAELLSEYLVKTKIYAESFFEMCETRNKWTEEDYCNYFGLEPRIAVNCKGTEYKVFPKGFHNTQNARSYDRMKNEYRLITEKGYELFLAKELKAANQHYNDSIDKLVFRLTQKGVAEYKEVIHQKLKENFEITILHYDGKKTKAWTIIASGPVQRPHYRFLVK